MDTRGDSADGGIADFDAASAEGMLKFMEMARLAQSVMSAGKRRAGNDSGLAPADFDAAVQSPALQTIKAAIPHLEPRYRKNMIVMVKLIEIQKLLTFYGENVIAAQSDGGDWRMSVLASIRQFMPEHKRKTIDMIIDFLNLSDFIGEIKAVRQ